MSIATELNRIIGAKSDMKTSIEAKGVTVPSNATIDAYHNYVDQITTGGGTPLVESTDLSDYSSATLGDASQFIKGVTIPASVTRFTVTPPISGSTIETIKVESGNTTFDSRNNCNAVIQTNNNSLIAGCKNTVFPNDIVSINNYAFQGCIGLTSASIPNTVTAIGNQAFGGCTGLTTMTLGSGVQTIGEYAFFQSGITGTLTIPNSITSIGNYAFCQCSGVTKIILPDKYISYGRTVFDSTSITSVGVRGSGADVEIPSQQTTIPENMFGTCRSLISVEFPEGVTTIQGGALHGCGVQTVIFPSTLANTGSLLLYNSNQLRTLTCKAVTPPSFSSNSLQTNSLQAIYVPAESVTAYQTAGGWSQYSSYIQAIPTT